MASTTISATIGVLLALRGGLQRWGNFGMLWRTWWLGDAMGDILLAPLLLTLPFWSSRQRDSSWFELLSLEALAITLSVAGLCEPRVRRSPLIRSSTPCSRW